LGQLREKLSVVTSAWFAQRYELCYKPNVGKISLEGFERMEEKEKDWEEVWR
jgi:hypothetical protein